MSAIKLTSPQKEAIGTHLGRFKSYLADEQYLTDQRERTRRVTFFHSELPARLPELSEADVTELVTMLWATAIWGNKQYHAQQVITENGIGKLCQELTKLLDASQPPGKRYERFVCNVKHLGPAAVTEMLTYISPDQCGIWNNRAREAVAILGLSNLINPKKYQLTGKEYDTFNAILHAIAEELRRAGVPDPDLLLVDFFLFDVAAHPGEELPSPPPHEGFDHHEIRDLVHSIGVMLGFDADTEVPVAHGAKVDVVWRARIGNLGLVTYVFEVHRSGSIDSLLLNLQKAKSSPTVQKVIAVSDEQQLETIRRECEGLPFEFHRALALWPVAEVQKVGEQLQAAIESINKLGLVQGF
jgi:hypothetical protein